MNFWGNPIYVNNNTLLKLHRKGYLNVTEHVKRCSTLLTSPQGKADKNTLHLPSD